MGVPSTLTVLERLQKVRLSGMVEAPRELRDPDVSLKVTIDSLNFNKKLPDDWAIATETELMAEAARQC